MPEMHGQSPYEWLLERFEAERRHRLPLAHPMLTVKTDTAGDCAASWSAPYDEDDLDNPEARR